MIRKSIVVSLGFGFASAGMAFAWHDGHQYGSVKPLTSWKIAEKVSGEISNASAVEVVFQPGQSGSAHRHPGPALGYVIEGEYEWAIDDQPAKVLKAGDTFYEPAGCLHRISKAAGDKQARILTWVIHPRETREIVIPEPGNDGGK
jgi:quercetin dioxygenase-like cupin family protein